jgi:DUF4097 and DUF4098 domain-containing protein YvlB
MIRKSLIALICILAAVVRLNAAQDFERKYAIVPGRHITIDNQMGNVKVTGYDGTDIGIVARMEGPDKEDIEIVDKSYGPRVVLFPVCSKFKSTQTRVDFEVKVPKTDKPVFMVLKSGSGKIEVSDFNGGLVVQSSRGEVKLLNVEGYVDAHSVSGNMVAEISQSKGRSQMSFNSLSGDIKVEAPPDLQALVAMRSVSGDLETNFPIDIQERRYAGNTARGKLGAGTQMIHLSSVSGNVRLLKK